MNLTHDQIQILLVEKLSGSITPEDDALIEHLLAADPELNRQWQRLLLELTRLGGSPSSLSEDDAWNKVKISMRPPRAGLARKFGTFRTGGFQAAAAVAFIIMISGAALLWNKRSTPPVARVPAANSTPAIALVLDNGDRILLQRPGIIRLGEWRLQADQQQMKLPTQTGSIPGSATLLVPPTLNYKLALSDGTEVWLNSQSRLRFPLNFQGPKREVFLQGEAYFKVGKDAGHPFIVHTDKTEVAVVGTQFNLNAYEKDSISTALVEGAVITRDSVGHSIRVRPGMQSVYTKANNFLTTSFDEAETLSWLKGVYYFHNTPLKNIAKVLDRWYDVESDFTNTHLQDLTFSGELIKTQSLQSFLDNLNLAEDMHASIHDGRIVFR